MISNVLYTDLSAYYDLLCADINYREQSDGVHRIHQLFGQGGKRYLDLGCGTGPHVRHFLDAGYQACGLDIHQPMLDIAQQRCPEAQFLQGDMATFTVEQPFDLMTCFLYSIHYNSSITALQACFLRVYAALQSGGVFCFNAVNKQAIDNSDGVRHSIAQGDSEFIFQSGWHYAGQGDTQQLLVSIEKTTAGSTECWQDKHTMVAVSFLQLQTLLQPLFEVQVLEHNYSHIEPWNGVSGNAIFVAVKK